MRRRKDGRRLLRNVSEEMRRRREMLPVQLRREAVCNVPQHTPWVLDAVGGRTGDAQRVVGGQDKRVGEQAAAV